MSKPHKTGTELSPEDKARMRRLSEEIVGRLTEMALITGRILGSSSPAEAISAPGGKVTITNKRGTAQRQRSLCVEIDGAVWEDPPGICRTGSC